MGRTTPRKFYEFFVWPNYDDFCAREDDVRLGFNASVAAFQMADIFFEYYQRNDPSVVAAWPDKTALLIELTKREPHFLTIQSVATVYKHLYASGGHYEVGSPMSLGGVVYQGTKVKTEWGSSESRVVVRRRRGSEVILKDALAAVVLRMWPAVLPDEEGE